jgi:hypothetical protein
MATAGAVARRLRLPGDDVDAADLMLHRSLQRLLHAP